MTKGNMFKTSIETHFSAAHRLIGYEGACGRIHGHTWRVRIEVETDRVNTLGLSIDFRELRRIAESVVGRLDHQDLNTIPPFDRENPTAELLARFLYREILGCLPEGFRLTEVTVWESDQHAVTYYEPENDRMGPCSG